MAESTSFGCSNVNATIFWRLPSKDEEADSKTWLWDAKLTATLPIESAYLKDIKLSLFVENLIDEEYYEYYIGRERSYFAELQLNW